VRNCEFRIAKCELKFAIRNSQFSFYPRSIQYSSNLDNFQRFQSEALSIKLIDPGIQAIT